MSKRAYRPTNAADLPPTEGFVIALNHYMTCACCGEELFEREEPVWWDDETETCSDCGCLNSISVDDAADEPTADTVLRCGADCTCEGCTE